MRIEKNTNKAGQVWYSIFHYDPATKRHVRLTRQFIQNRFGKDLTTEQEAEAAKKELESEFESASKRVEESKKWEESYDALFAKVKDFESKVKMDAPKSWETRMHFLGYSIRYFTQVAQVKNINLWCNYRDKFKLWLENDSRQMLQKDKSLSYHSKNHIINSFNLFMKHLHEEGTIDNWRKVKPFRKELLKSLGLEDIIKPDEFKQVFKALLGIDPDVAWFFSLCYWTGMRYSEAAGVAAIHLNDKEEDDPKFDQVKKLLAKNKVKFYGYILINTQLDCRNMKVGDKPKRCALKEARVINEKSTKTIPIIDKRLWNELARRHEQAVDNPRYREPDLNLLFPGMFARVKISNKLKQAFEVCGLKYRSWHKCRHSRSTLIHGEIGSSELAAKWLGHKKPSVIENYNHSYVEFIRSIKQKNSGKRKLKQY